MIEFFTLVGKRADGTPDFDMGGTGHRKICSYRYVGVARTQRRDYMKYNFKDGATVGILRTAFNPATGESTVEWVD